MLQTSMGLKNLFNTEALQEELDMLIQAGFDTADLSFDSKEVRAMLHAPDCDARMKAACNLFKEKNFTFYQGHAPFHPYAYNDPEKTRINQEDIRLSIPYAAMMGVEYLVVHPIFAPVEDPLHAHPDKLLKMNIDYYTDLMAYAATYGVKICTENMFATYPDKTIAPCFAYYAEDLVRLMDAVNDLYVCMDNGHAVLAKQDLGDMTRAFGSRLKTLHLHGNNFKSDLHVSPFECKEAPWESLYQGLRDIRYTGSINLEADYFYIYAPPAIKPAAISFLHTCAAHIASQCSL